MKLDLATEKRWICLPVSGSFSSVIIRNYTVHMYVIYALSLKFIYAKTKHFSIFQRVRKRRKEERKRERQIRKKT